MQTLVRLRPPLAQAALAELLPQQALPLLPPPLLLVCRMQRKAQQRRRPLVPRFLVLLLQKQRKLAHLPLLLPRLVR